MVEGPTAKAYALRVCNEFKDEIVREILAKSKKIFIPVKELIGKKFAGSDSIGKNIILFFNGIAVRVHLMMFGVIHIYQLDEPLLKPEERVRLLIKGNRKKLVVYNAPIVEIDRRENILNRLRRDLGPDSLSDEWNRKKAIENLRKFPDEKIGVVLLNQSVIAGIGNILRNEILFRARVHPERAVKNLSDKEIERIIQVTEDLMKEFLKLKMERKSIRDLLLVYNKYKGFCKSCGNLIKFYRQQPINRKTFVCENCQK